MAWQIHQIRGLIERLTPAQATLYVEAIQRAGGQLEFAPDVLVESLATMPGWVEIDDGPMHETKIYAVDTGPTVRLMCDQGKAQFEPVTTPLADYA